MQKEKDFLDRLRVIHLAKNNINSMLGLIVVTILVFAIFIDDIPKELLTAYLLTMISQALIRLHYYRKVLKNIFSIDNLNIKSVENIFALFASFSAISYSLFAISFFSYLTETNQIFLLVIATGKVAVTFNSNAASSKIFIPYSVLTITPFAIWYGLQGTPPEIYISLFIIIFMIVFINSSKSVNQYIISFLEAKQDNEHLLLNLKKRKKALEETNQNLKDHIEKNQSLKEKLVQQESLAGLGVLTAGLAHEIRNPLNIIINSSVILKEIINEYTTNKEEVNTQDLIDDAKISIDLIATEGEKANDIVTHLLSTYSHQKSSDKSSFDIDKLIKSVAETTQLAMKGKISSAKGIVEIDSKANVKTFEGYESELNKVLLCIIYNSFEAIEEKYQFDPENFKPLVKIESKLIEDTIVITIYDNGIGVKEENINKVFTPFFTTKPTNKATGLGLSSSYEIIKNLFQGEVKLDSKQGQFTRVEIILPLKTKD